MNRRAVMSELNEESREVHMTRDLLDSTATTILRDWPRTIDLLIDA